MPKHCGNLPPFHSVERLWRRSTLPKCLTQPLKVQLWEGKVEHEQSGRFSLRTGNQSSSCGAAGFGSHDARIPSQRIR
jgi:hypothetical protein